MEGDALGETMMFLLTPISGEADSSGPVLQMRKSQRVYDVICPTWGSVDWDREGLSSSPASDIYGGLW